MGNLPEINNIEALQNKIIIEEPNGTEHRHREVEQMNELQNGEKWRDGGVAYLCPNPGLGELLVKVKSSSVGMYRPAFVVLYDTDDASGTEADSEGCVTVAETSTNR